ncbi:type II TA system antitoxin MqsA family protein [Chromobacterium haemolyticum]|uniref:type II TA system antitoxin MqsA family protein n=1 Tax=Chromobacterium TaxID=535 RepID=UPI00405687E1
MAHHCLNCEAAEMVLETKDVTVSYKHLSAVVPAVTGWHCPHCGEIEFTDEASSRRHMDALQELAQRQRAETRFFVKATRQKLKLTQAAAAKIFGGGVNAFSEYERGVTQPPVATIKLLKVLDKHPDLLREVVEA